MAVPAMTQRNAGSAKAGEEAGAEAEASAARSKGMISIVKALVCLLWVQEGLRWRRDDPHKSCELKLRMACGCVGYVWKVSVGSESQHRVSRQSLAWRVL